MTASTQSFPQRPSLPIPIFLNPHPQPRYLLYDPSTVHFLRVNHNILGVLIGTLPQIPSQSVFLGLPLQLLPEEVHLLVQKGVAYIVDDKDRHGRGGDFRQKMGTEREAILAELQMEGLKIARGIERRRKDKTDEALRRQRMQQKKAGSSTGTPTREDPDLEDDADEEQTSTATDSSTLFSGPSHSPSPNLENPLQHQQPLEPHTITPTSTLPLPPPPYHTSPPTTVLPSPTSTTPARLALHGHLHSHGYTLTPGLRFGCHFSVYPGDPLRFHSHFLANAYDWDEKIELIDLVGGGRLGTGVKKGWLVGGVQPTKDAEVELEAEAEAEAETGETRDGEHESHVRCFCIEWAGM